ncbi:THAP domain-containing protein 5-like [Bufo gargarizans]|uniref:THAP domain-containing protein 5-like n=1 Tax=Bufo gargarizans TaxID=30331 RepID=UPI001CF3915F|nr:THAP domain-containing protein 5-like [Bufo gargarizans]
MPKSCVVPECRRAETGLESYYKFPLHDKVRLKQWLTNMNLENFFPTKSLYLCSKHFKQSCFQTRWGARYLRHDAVPTIFSSSLVASSKTQVSKSKTVNSTLSLGDEVCLPTVSPLVIGETQVLPDTLMIAVDPNSSTGPISLDGAAVLVKNTDPTGVIGAVNLVPLVHFVESFDGLSLALAPNQGFQSVALPIQVTGGNQIQQIGPVGFLSQEHIATTTLQQNYYDGQVLQSVVPAIVQMTGESNPGNSAVENISIEPFFEAGLPAPPPATMTTEAVMSYLETMQTATLVPVLPSGPLPPLIPSQETILSCSAASPIVSTVPIVSKHSKEVSSGHGSQVLAMEPSKGPDGLAETSSTAELVSVVMNLQKKVTTLQQRHQKHCTKLEVMEGVVDQLKKENLISEDKLNFLDLARLNSAPVQAEGAETIAILCDDEDQALLYSLPFQGENQSILRITKQ